MKSAFGATLFFILMGYALILPSTAAAAPSSTITSPNNLSVIYAPTVTPPGSVITVTGTAASDTGTLTGVEVSVNDGTFKPATDTSAGHDWSSWSYSLQVHSSGIYHIKSRATDSVPNVETVLPDSGVKVDLVLPTATGSISGIVSYTGLKPGLIYIGAFTDPVIGSGGSLNPLASTAIVSPGAYTLTGVPAGTFYVGAVKTNNINNVLADDPIGAYLNIASPTGIAVSGNAVTGKSFAINNTSTNQLFKPVQVNANYVDGTPATMHIEFAYKDPTTTFSTPTASGVTVTGPGITGAITLAYNKTDGRWVSWGVDSANSLDGLSHPDVSLQYLPTDTWPSATAPYTFTVDNGVAGTVTYDSTIKTYMTDFPKIQSPNPASPDVYGSVVFSWSPVPTALFYEIELNGPGGGWQLSETGPHNFTGTSFTYNGPALTEGQTYNYWVSARDVNDNSAMATGSFTYHNSDDTTPPVSAITGPLNGAAVSGDSLVSTGITGTASDTGGTIPSPGVQAVQVSIDGGTNWLYANDTSGGSWSTWNILWPSPGPLANGALTVKSRAIDQANNIETPLSGIAVNIDVTKPTSAFTFPADNSYIKTKPFTITGTAFDTGSGVGLVEFSHDNGFSWESVTDTSAAHNWSTWSNTANPATPDDVYHIQCKATDKAGNVQAPTTAITVTVDTTPPTVSVDSPVNNAALNGTTAAISGSASDALSGVSKVEVSTDGGVTWKGPATTPAVTDTSGNGSWSSWSYTWTLPADGNYVIKARATDKAGNVTPLASIPSVAVKVDKTRPTAAITLPAAGAWVKGSSFNVTGTAADPAALNGAAGSGVVSVFVAVDSVVLWNPVTSGTTAWSYNWSLPIDGPHTLQVKSVDKAGNESLIPAGRTVMVDSTPPSSTITQPLPSATLSGTTYTVTGTANDGTGSGVSKVVVSTDGGTTWDTLHPATGTTSWSYTWTLPANGSYTIKSRATDVAGNVEDTTLKTGVAVTVNKVMPASSITAPVSGKNLTGASVTITGKALGGVSGATAYALTKVEVSTDNGLTWKGPTDTPGVKDTSGYPTSGLPRWSTWSYAWTLPADGNYTLISKATNNQSANNVEDLTNKAAITVTVDKAPPSVSTTDPSSGEALNSTPYNITGTAGDIGGSGVAKVECGITPAVVGGVTTWYPATATSGGYATWSCNWTLPADGLYTVKSRATDKAGNVTTTAPLSVRVDKTKPTVAMTAPPLTGISVPAALGTYSIKGTAADTTGSGVQKVEVSTDGGLTWKGPADGVADTSVAHNWTAWKYVWPLPSEGSYVIKSKSTDNAGNVSAANAGNTVKVDGTPPIALLTQPNKNAILDGTSYVIKGTASDSPGGSGVKKVEIAIDGAARVLATGTTSWSYTWSLTNVPYGGHLIQYWVTDNAGNQSGEYDRSVTVDKTVPASAITAPLTGKALKGTTTITGTAFKGASATATSLTKVEVSTDGGAHWYGPTDTPGVKDTSGYPTSGLPRFSTWSYAWTPPGEGPYTLVSRATNNLGVEDPTNTNKAVVNVTVDKTNPTSSITTPDGSVPLNGTTVPITGTAGDPVSTGVASGVAKVEVSTNGGVTWVLATDTSAGHDLSTWSYNWTLGVDGPYTLKSRATDKAGNVLLTGDSSVLVRVDKTRPTSAITSPLAGANLSGISKTITGTAGDVSGSGVDKVEVSINGGTWTETTGTTNWSYTWPLPADGSYNIKTRATDNAGNVQVPGAGITVKVDNTQPNVAITAPASGTLINNALTRTITGTAADTGGSGVSGVAVSFDGGGTWKPAVDTSNSLVTGKAPWSTWSYAWTITTTATTSITARATDKAGNTSTAAVGVTVSPKLFSSTFGIWNFTYTPPPGGGSVVTGTLPLTANDAGGLTINIPNNCHTVYTGTFTGMSANLTSTNETLKHDSGPDTCDALGAIVLSFSNMRNATGTVTGPDGTGTVRLWR